MAVGYVLGPRSADRVRDMLGEGPPPTRRRRASGGDGDPPWALVRCTSATAAGGSGVDATLYPGQRVTGDATTPTPADATNGTVWLTVLGPGGTPVTPANGQVYTCLVGGWATVGSDSRPRAIAPKSAGGSTTFTTYRYTCSGGSLVETPTTVTVTP